MGDAIVDFCCNRNRHEARPGVMMPNTSWAKGPPPPAASSNAIVAELILNETTAHGSRPMRRPVTQASQRYFTPCIVIGAAQRFNARSAALASVGASKAAPRSNCATKRLTHCATRNCARSAAVTRNVVPGWAKLRPLRRRLPPLFRLIRPSICRAEDNGLPLPRVRSHRRGADG